ncbi:IMPACT family protein [bacterium]
MDDLYHTLKQSCSSECKIKGSRFIGYATVVSEPEEADHFIRGVTKKHHNATHACFAYRIGYGDKSVFRYSDAGEPAGTAGRPILDAIDGKKLTNTVCVVIRYFGGTKLGTGGLARAYSQCSVSTLEKGGVEERYITIPVRIAFHYDLTGAVMHLVSRFHCQVEDTHYGSETIMSLTVRRSRVETFKSELVNLSAGKVRFLEEGNSHR